MKDSPRLQHNASTRFQPERRKRPRKSANADSGTPPGGRRKLHAREDSIAFWNIV